jgi:long-chain fatty acid transport protein
MLFFNPASQAWLRGTQVVSLVSGIMPTAEVRSATASRNPLLGGGAIAGSLGGDAGYDALVPGFYATTALAPGWRLGVGVTAPFGLVTKYPADFIGRYHALTSSLRTINVTPALSWQPTPTLALGVGLQIQHASARLSSAVDFGGVGFLNPQLRAAGFRPGLFDGRSTISGDDTAVGWQVGAQWEPRPGTRLGAGFRSAVAHTLRGDATFEGAPGPLALSPQFQNTGGQARLTTPESVTLGLSQRVGERLTLLAGAEWTNWSRFQQLVITFANNRPDSVTEQRWKDSWFLSAGAEYRLTDTLTLRGGVAWDQTPVRTEHRTPRIPDTDRTWLSFGATWQALPKLALTAAYTHVFAGDAELRLRDRGGPGTSDFLRGNLDATARASVNIVSVQARYTF